MKNVLQNTLLEIDGEKTKLETVLSCISDGIIAFTDSGAVLHSNESAAELFAAEMRRKFTMDTFFELMDIPLELSAEENTESPVPDLIEEAERQREGIPDDGSNRDAITVRLVYDAPKEEGFITPGELFQEDPAPEEKSGLTGKLLKLAAKFRGK
jgi:PAS domain-containing protein